MGDTVTTVTSTNTAAAIPLPASFKQMPVLTFFKTFFKYFKTGSFYYGCFDSNSKKAPELRMAVPPMNALHS
jgi:hypothetical protein